ncbi:unnamed protein product [Acanthoscelides obtectus]|uniref:Uncharacterized protein n=1 Tax=Acanthoscelides obtectus TaxID=200917 RepID=A0A9P0JIZ4_ACAOB|nr:unnamed protein product [Acanthoscelides obtectus]CAK1661462.1 hypothetical protein AOBTE_LOCUS22639 [Acanthoscelides obtectus]
MYSIIRNVNQLRLPLHIAKNTLPSVCTLHHMVRFKHAETKSNQLNVAALQSIHKNHFKPICSKYLDNLRQTRGFCRRHPGVTSPPIITYKTHLKYHSFFDLSRKKKKRQLKEPRTAKDTVEERDCINEERKPKVKRGRSESNVETVSSTIKLTNNVTEIKKKKNLIRMHGINKISNFIFKQLDCRFCMEGKGKPNAGQGGPSMQKRAYSSATRTVFGSKFETKKEKFKKNSYESAEYLAPQEKQDTMTVTTIRPREYTLTQSSMANQEREKRLPLDQSNITSKVMTSEPSVQMREYSTKEVDSKFEVKKNKFKKNSYELLKDSQERDTSIEVTPIKRMNYKELMLTQNSLIKKEHGTRLTKLLQKNNNYSGDKKAVSLKYDVNTSNVILTGKHSQKLVTFKYVDRHSHAMRSKSLDDLFCRKEIVEGSKGDIDPRMISEVVKASKTNKDSKSALANTIGTMLKPLLEKEYLKYMEVHKAVEQLENTLKIYLGDHLSDRKDRRPPIVKREIKDPLEKIEIADPKATYSKMDPVTENEMKAPSARKEQIKEPWNDEFVILSMSKKKGKKKKKKAGSKSSKSGGSGGNKDEPSTKKEVPSKKKEELPKKAEKPKECKTEDSYKKKEDSCKKEDARKNELPSKNEIENLCKDLSKKNSEKREEELYKQTDSKKKDTACNGIPKKEASSKKEAVVSCKKDDCPSPPMKEDKCNCFPNSKADPPCSSVSGLPSPFKVAEPMKTEPFPKLLDPPKPLCPDEAPFKPPPCKDLSKETIVLVSRKDPIKPAPPKSPPPSVPDPCKLPCPSQFQPPRSMGPAEITCPKTESLPKRSCCDGEPKPCQTQVPNVQAGEVKCNKCGGEELIKRKTAEAKGIGADYCKQVPMPEDCPMKIDCSAKKPHEMSQSTCQMQRSCSRPSMEPKGPPNQSLIPPPNPTPTGAEGRFKGRVTEIPAGQCSKQKSCRSALPLPRNEIFDAPPSPLGDLPNKSEPQANTPCLSSKANLKKVAPNPVCVPSKTDLRYCKKKPVPKEDLNVDELKPHPSPIPPSKVKEEAPCIPLNKGPQQALKKDWAPVRIGTKHPKAKIVRPVCRPQSSPPGLGRSSPPKPEKKIKLSAEPPKPPEQKKGILDSCKGIINSVCSVFCPGKGGNSRKKASAGTNLAISRSLPEFRSADSPGCQFGLSGEGTGSGRGSGKSKKKSAGFLFLEEDSTFKSTDDGTSNKEGIKNETIKHSTHSEKHIQKDNAAFIGRKSNKRQRHKPMPRLTFKMIDHVSLCSAGRKRKNTLRIRPKPLTPPPQDMHSTRSFAKKANSSNAKKEDPCKEKGGDSEKVKWSQFEGCKTGMEGSSREKEEPSKKEEDPCKTKGDSNKGQGQDSEKVKWNHFGGCKTGTEGSRREKKDLSKKKEDPCKSKGDSIKGQGQGSEKVKWNQFKGCGKTEQGDSGKDSKQHPSKTEDLGRNNENSCEDQKTKDAFKKEAAAQKNGPSGGTGDKTEPAYQTCKNEQKRKPCGPKKIVNIRNRYPWKKETQEAMQKVCVNQSYLTKMSEKNEICDKRKGPPRLEEKKSEHCFRGGSAPKKADPCKKKPQSPKKKDDRRRKKSIYQLEEKSPDCLLKSGSAPKKAEPCKKKPEPPKKEEDPCKKKSASQLNEKPSQSDCFLKSGSANKKDPSTPKKAEPCTKVPEPPKEKEDPCKKKSDTKLREKSSDCSLKSGQPKKKDPCDDFNKKQAQKKKDPCVKKDEDPHKKKKDPCADFNKKQAQKKKDPCEKKEENPCKKKKDPCEDFNKKQAQKKEDPCEKKDDPCKKKEDPCEDFNKKQVQKKKDPCEKKEKDPCKEKKDLCENINKKRAQKGDKDPCK